MFFHNYYQIIIIMLLKQFNTNKTEILEGNFFSGEGSLWPPIHILNMITYQYEILKTETHEISILLYTIVKQPV